MASRHSACTLGVPVTLPKQKTNVESGHPSRIVEGKEKGRVGGKDEGREGGRREGGEGEKGGSGCDSEDQ